MASFNKVILMGNLTRDPELSYTPQGVAVAKFDLAVNEKWHDKEGKEHEETLFMPIVVWKKQAENVAKYLKKGLPCFVEGKITENHWEKDGVKHHRVKVTASTVKFLGKKPESQEQGPGPAPADHEAEQVDCPF